MMKLIETKKVKVGAHMFTVAYSNRALFAHLQRMKDQPDSPEVILNFYYDLCKAGAKLEGKPFDFTFEQFCDAVDPDPDVFIKFGNILNEYLPDDTNDKKK